MVVGELFIELARLVIVFFFVFLHVVRAREWFAYRRMAALADEGGPGGGAVAFVTGGEWAVRPLTRKETFWNYVASPLGGCDLGLVSAALLAGVIRLLFFTDLLFRYMPLVCYMAGPYIIDRVW